MQTAVNINSTTATNVAARGPGASSRQHLFPDVVRFTSLYSFKGGSDGRFPQASLLDFNGTLYGTTEGGGSNNGTVFKITMSGKETVLHNFTGNSDGYGPFAGLVNVNGTLYGTTEGGGEGSEGILFTITPSGKKTTIYSFGTGRSDAQAPTGNLLNLNGTLYGTTVGGGTFGYGAVFQFAPSRAARERVLHSFNAGGTDGYKPFGAGVVALNGALYGTTYMGGSGCQEGGCGTVFTISPSSGEHVIYSFGSGGKSDGASPLAAPIALNDILYGTTYSGGTSGGGTVFEITRSGQEAILHSFGSSNDDGAKPETGLIAVNGTLFGTTAYGGAHGAGTIFKITPSGTESVLYNFSGPDGAAPAASLIAVHGTLYGTTEGGGTYGSGTVFSLALQPIAGRAI